MACQGEGVETGQFTVFVRLGGCNLECEWCDTKYSWYDMKQMTINEVYSKVRELDRGAKHATLSGGEPLLQDKDLAALCRMLKDDGYTLSIETNASLKPPFESLKYMDTIVASPKFGHISFSFLKWIKKLKGESYLKFVVKNMNEVNQAITFKRNTRNPIYIQPVDGDIELAKKIIDNVPDTRKLRMSFQVHKYIFGNERGR